METPSPRLTSDFTAEEHGPPGRLADFLSLRKERICAEWIAAVRQDEEIPSADGTPDPLLMDHVPKLLDGLFELLRSSAGELMPDSAVEDARAHGIQRFSQGFDLSEMIRELADLRAVLISHVEAYAAEDAQFAGPVRERSVLRIHRLLDESSRWSILRFAREQQDGLAAASQSRLNVLRGVSHELGNALNGIGFAGRALKGASAEQITEIAEALKRGVHHMREMLDDLRELASLAAGQEKISIHPFPPLSLAQDIRTTYGPLAEEKGLKFSCEMDPSLREIVSDERRIKQIVANLVSNAIKYTAAGEVRVDIRAVDADKWAIIVRDTGVGIAPHHQEKIFHEFFRVDETSRAEGMGLGLAVATRLVQFLGGETHLESTLGEGSTFEVVLPKTITADQLSPS